MFVAAGEFKIMSTIITIILFIKKNMISKMSKKDTTLLATSETSLTCHKGKKELFEGNQIVKNLDSETATNQELWWFKELIAMEIQFEEHYQSGLEGVKILLVTSLLLSNCWQEEMSKEIKDWQKKKLRDWEEFSTMETISIKTKMRKIFAQFATVSSKEVKNWLNWDAITSTMRNV